MNKELENKLKRVNRLGDYYPILPLNVRIDEIPNRYFSKEHPLFEYNKQLINATHTFTSIYSFNLSHYRYKQFEEDLEDTIHYIKTMFSGKLVFLDARAGAYCQDELECMEDELFHRYDCDILSVTPSYGQESVSYFSTLLKDKGFVAVDLTKLSNANDCLIESVCSDEFENMMFKYKGDLGGIKLSRAKSYLISDLESYKGFSKEKLKDFKLFLELPRETVLQKDIYSAMTEIVEAL